MLSLVASSVLALSASAPDAPAGVDALLPLAPPLGTRAFVGALPVPGGALALAEADGGLVAAPIVRRGTGLALGAPTRLAVDLDPTRGAVLDPDGDGRPSFFAPDARGLVEVAPGADGALATGARLDLVGALVGWVDGRLAEVELPGGERVLCGLVEVGGGPLLRPLWSAERLSASAVDGAPATALVVDGAGRGWIACPAGALAVDAPLPLVALLGRADADGGLALLAQDLDGALWTLERALPTGAGALGGPWRRTSVEGASVALAGARWLDLDGDGALDLVTGGAHGPELRRGWGRTGFLPPLELAPAPGAELGLVETDGGVLRITTGALLPAGTGGERVALPFALEGPLAAVDLDGDGDVDLSTARAQGRNDGSGAFAFERDEAPHAFRVERAPFGLELPRAGRVDVLVELDGGRALGLSTLLADGTAAAPRRTAALEGELLAALAVDTDGDGRDEVALLTTRGVSLFDVAAEPWTPCASFDLPSSDGARLVAADLDGDGRDALLVLHGERLVVLRRAGAGLAADVRVAPRGAVVLDLDGDGDLDLAGLAPGGDELLLVRGPRHHGPLAGALLQYDLGAPGAGGVVPLLGAQGPVRLGDTGEVRLVGVRPHADVFLAVTPHDRVLDQRHLGLTVVHDPGLLTWIGGVADERGTFRFPLDFVPTLVGHTLRGQAFALDAAAAAGTSVSNRLAVTFGR